LAIACVLWTLGGIVLLVGSLLLWDALNLRDLAARTRLYVGAASAFGLVWVFGWAWTVFNSLISLRNRVAEGWALVDVQLKRRNDLIPNLVRTASALKDYERGVQSEIAALRGQLGATPPGKPGEDYRALRPVLTVLFENYPALKSDDAFLNLQRSVVETESRIALARDYYNSIATHCNTRLRRMPDGLIALLTATRPQPLLLAPDFERAAVKVEFASS
jgi:hypothetical protein